MTDEWLIHKCCPFFQVQLNIRKVTNLIQVWYVVVKPERSRRDLYIYKGYSIGDQVVVEEKEAHKKPLVERILYGPVFGLKDPWWWHTILCRVCPITKDYRLCEESGDSDSESEDGCGCASGSQWALEKAFPLKL